MEKSLEKTALYCRTILSVYLIITGFFLIMLVPIHAFALMDVEAYFGYDFNGKIDNTKTDNDITGYNVGLRGDYLYHLNIFDLGIGGYTEITPLNYTISQKDYELNKLSFGIDSFVRLGLPNFDFHPYVRGGMAIYDRSETTILNEKNISVLKFNSYYFGPGLSYSVVPLPVINVHVFTEYLFEISRVQKNKNIKFDRINIGILMAI